jgi:hypothetical protein
LEDATEVETTQEKINMPHNDHDELLKLVREIHDLNLALVKLWRLNFEQMEKLVDRLADAREMEKLVGKLKGPTDALAEAVKENQ